MNKILYIIISLTCSFNIVSAQMSHVQVVCEPGIKIFLDGYYKGTSNAELGGYIIENIGLGDHIIKVVKEGFTAQEEKIWVQKGEVFIYRVKHFTPTIKITQKGNEKEQSIERKTGSLKIQSLPVEIEINIPELNIQSIKTEDEWLAEELPVGEYSINYRWKDRIKNQTIKIKEGQQTTQFINLTELKSRFLPYNLSGRFAKSIPKPSYPGNEEGVVVVKITVDKYGNVTAAEAGVRGTTIEDKRFWNETKKAASKAKFNADDNAPAFQQGTISYRFVLD